MGGGGHTSFVMYQQFLTRKVSCLVTASRLRLNPTLFVYLCVLHFCETLLRPSQTSFKCQLRHSGMFLYSLSCNIILSHWNSGLKLNLLGGHWRQFLAVFGPNYGFHISHVEHPILSLFYLLYLLIFY